MEYQSVWAEEGAGAIWQKHECYQCCAQLKRDGGAAETPRRLLRHLVVLLLFLPGA